MRILLAVIHYFSPEADPKHSSVDPAAREMRQMIVQGLVERYRGLFGRPSSLDIGSKTFLRLPGAGDEIDIAIITVPGCSLLSPDFLSRFNAVAVNSSPDNPRMLGFAAHELFAQHRGEYDMFAYTEDDLLPNDPDLFNKIAWFAAHANDRRVLLPARYEWNGGAKAIKTYIDGDLGPNIEPLLSRHRDDGTVTLQAFDRPRTFARTRNPHSGFFAITQFQLAHWMRQPHWLDRDCGFVTPLESAATLGIAKTFPIYKPYGSSVGFLELHHSDRRYSSLDWRWGSTGLQAQSTPPRPSSTDTAVNPPSSETPTDRAVGSE